MGILLKAQTRDTVNQGILHECGDPILCLKGKERPTKVFSTSVGILSDDHSETAVNLGILHECGDPISSAILSIIVMMYSPRVWGSYLLTNLLVISTMVFSTSVGILSTPMFLTLLPSGYSPRVWGSYQLLLTNHQKKLVFSTSVGILFKSVLRNTTQCGILHECGDPIIFERDNK